MLGPSPTGNFSCNAMKKIVKTVPIFKALKGGSVMQWAESMDGARNLFETSYLFIYLFINIKYILCAMDNLNQFSFCQQLKH